jgi:FkbM family methyltransferase
MQWLRTLLRKPYHLLLKRSKKGFRLNIGGVMPVRLPGEFCAKELENYEAISAEAICDWSNQHSGGLFVDIGCSYGYFSCGFLFADPTATVIAIDADLPSLSIAQHVCRYAPEGSQRLELVHALVTPETSNRWDFDSLIIETHKSLQNPELRLDPKQTNYVNLDTRISEQDLPRISLDDLLAKRLEETDAPSLIKCDVEGAEILVLQGARTILERCRPTLLVSVHPPYLPRFDGSVDEIQELLKQAGYEYDVIDIDHEEHWLCQPI